MQIKEKEEWIREGKQYKKPYIFFNGYCLDLTKFICLHPGGSNAIKNYLYKDMSTILFSVFPHDYQRTPTILQQYRVGKVQQVKKDKEQQMQQSKIIKTILRSHKRIRKGTVVPQNQPEQQKKIVQFPSQIKRLASQKQKLQQNSMVLSKKLGKKSLSKNAKKFSVQDKINSRTKNINPDYKSKLKDLKQKQTSINNKNKQNSSTSVSPIINDIENKKKYNESKNFQRSQKSIKSKSSINVSIKDFIRSSCGSFPQLKEEQHPIIKIPVLNVRINKLN